MAIGGGLRAGFDDFSACVDGRIFFCCTARRVLSGEVVVICLLINPRYSAGDAGDDIAGDGSGAGG